MTGRPGTAWSRASGRGSWPAYPSCASHPGPGSRSGCRRRCRPCTSRRPGRSPARRRRSPASRRRRCHRRPRRSASRAGRRGPRATPDGPRREPTPAPARRRRARRRPRWARSVTVLAGVPAGVRPDAAGPGPGVREALERGGLGRRDPGPADAEVVGVDRAAGGREDAADRGTDDGAGDADGGEQDGGAHGGQGARGHLDPVDLDTVAVVARSSLTTMRRGGPGSRIRKPAV